MVECTVVPPERIEEFIPLAIPFLQRAVDRPECDDWTLDEALTALREKSALLWFAIDGGQLRAAVMTRVIPSKFGDVCVIVLCSGKKARTWVPLIAGIEKYARNEGCKRMRVSGRDGWARMLPDYKPTMTVLEKAI